MIDRRSARTTVTLLFALTVTLANLTDSAQALERVPNGTGKGKNSKNASEWIQKALSEAAEISDKLSNQVDDLKAVALSAVAEVQAIAGDLALAKETLDEATIAAAGQADDPNKVVKMCAVAKAQALLGMGDASRKTFSRAVEWTSILKDPDKKAQSQLAVATGQAEAQDLPGALATVSGIADSGTKLRALIGICRLQAQLGKDEEFARTFQDARKLLDRSGEDHFAQLSIVDLLAQRGDFGGAKAAAEKITHFQMSPTAMCYIARSLAKKGRVAEALTMAKGIKSQSQDDKLAALIAIARAQIDQGAREGGEQTLEEAKAAAAGFLSNNPETQRAQKLGAIAELFARIGKLDKARTALTEARISATEAPNKFYHWAFGLKDVAVAQARTNDIKGAKAPAATIPNAEAKAIAFRMIAETQAAQGDLAGAEVTLKSIAESQRGARCHGYLAIARVVLGVPANASTEDE